MIGRILSLSVRGRWAVAFLVLVVCAFGAWQATRLPIDAVPDITNRQVQVSTFAPSLGPVEIEKQVTYAVETALSGIPGLSMTRSLSRNGFSQVTAVFSDATDIYFARQQVTERLTQARATLPQGVQPQLGPISTGLGEIYMYTVEFQHPGGRGAKVKDGSPGWQSDGSYLTAEGERLSGDIALSGYLRTVQDWILRPQLRTVKGVAGVDSLGGYVKQYVVQPDITKLANYGLSLDALAQALERANVAAGANYIQRAGEAFIVRTDSRLRSLPDISRAVVGTRGGVPIQVSEVAEVTIGGAVRAGAASKMASPAVVSTVLMLVGENSRIVASAAGQKLKELNRSLPADIVARPAYDRSRLVTATIGTVEKNLTEGAFLVVAVLFLLLGNIRAALITAAVIPITMLMTATGMNALKVSGNLMSLGALDFGLIVDGAVIIVENSLRRLAERQHHEGRLLTTAERMEETTSAAQEMIRPTIFGQAIIFLVFAPLLTFEGVEGKTFSPMALTLMIALASAFVLSLTFVPAMIAILMRGKVSEKEVAPVRIFKRVYAPALHQAIRRPLPFIAGGVVAFGLAALLFGRLGQEFIPQLDEKDVTVTSFRVPSTSVDQSAAMQIQIERTLRSMPEVAMVFSKTGVADLGTDPMPPNASDAYIILKPKEDWPKDIKSKAEVQKRIEDRLAVLVGNRYEMAQPIQMRFNELIAGVRSDVALKLYGDDLEVMTRLANDISNRLSRIPGAADVRAEQTEGAPTFDVRIDRDAAARFGVSVADITETVAAALGGRESGQIFQGDRRFNVVLRLPDVQRNDVDTLGAIPVILPDNRGTIPLREVVRFAYTDGLNQISRENGKRLVIVQANVRGRDLGGFVQDAQAEVGRMTLPPGVTVGWGGKYENLQSASQRLALVVPACFALILGLLYMALGGVRPALIVFSAVPMGLAGGVFALVARQIPFSVSAAVGFIALSGVAVLNGLVLIGAIQKRLEDGESLNQAVVEGAMERVRPVLMTALVASLGFVPMAIATGTGAEVQRPLATVVIGGLITATVLTLLVLPAICRLFLLPRSRRDAARPAPSAQAPLAHPSAT